MDIRIGVLNNELFGFWNNDQAIVNSVINTTGKFAASEIRAVGVFDVATPALLRPANPIWDFLGVGAGDPVYILPSSGSPSTLPFLGFSTEDPSTAGFDAIRMSLIGMTGPTGGVFSFYSTSDWHMNTLGGPTGSVTLQRGTHSHFNLAFSQLGFYDLTFRLEALKDNAVEMVGSDVFRFQIVDSFAAVPEPTSALLLAPALLGLAIRSARRRAASRFSSGNDL